MTRNRRFSAVVSALGCAAVLLATMIASSSAWAQTGSPSDTTRVSNPTTAAIADLSNAKFSRRQKGYRFLINRGVDSITALEQAASGDDLNVAERCVKALVAIAADAEAKEAVIKAIGRLANNDSVKVAAFASHELEQLTMTDEERAVKALEAAQVRIHRDQKGDPYSVTIHRDQDIHWLQFLPKLRSVSLMQPGVGDQGIKFLVACDQIERLSLYQTSVTDRGLALLPELDSLRSLSLSGGKFSADGIRSLKHIQRLRSLMWSTGIDEQQLAAIGDLTQISSLALSNVVVTQQVVEVVNGLENLTSLNLSLTDLADEQCESLAKLKVPTSISLMRAVGVTANGWASLAATNLRSLMIYRSALTDAEMPSIGAITSLNTLSITDAPISDEGLGHLQTLTNLRYLNLRGTKVTEDGGNRLKEKLPNLRTIRINSQGFGIGQRAAANQPPYSITEYTGKKHVHMRATLTDAILEKLKNEKDIDTVFMTQVATNDSHLKLIAKLPIKGLVIKSAVVTDFGLDALRKHESLEALTITSPLVSDASVDALCDIPALKTLWMHEAQLTDAGVQKMSSQLAVRNELTWLNLSNCPGLTDDALSHLGRLQSLEKLTFGYNPSASSSVLRHLRDLPNLTEIRLEATKIESEDLRHLQTLKIQRLYFTESKLGAGVAASLADSCPELTYLGLAKTNVTDADMSAIGKLKKLQWLWLYETRVGDPGLAKLDELSNLDHVYVDAAVVTHSGEQRFKEKHPNAILQRQ